MSGAVRASAHRVWVIAKEEYRRALESRWLFGFTALFAALVLGLSYFGLAQSREVGFQGFEPVARGNPEIGQHPRLIQQAQFAQGCVLNVRRQFSTSPPGPDRLRLGVGEALDHDCV